MVQQSSYPDFGSIFEEEDHNPRMLTGDSNLSWIIEVGGQIGIPLGERPLLWTGPPKGEQPRSPSYDSDDAKSGPSPISPTPPSWAWKFDELQQLNNYKELAELSAVEEGDAEQNISY